MKAYNLNDIKWVGIETSNICNMTCDYCPKSQVELNQLRTVGSPFSGCRNCMGYKNNYEKLAKTVLRKLPRAKIKFST